MDWWAMASRRQRVAHGGPLKLVQSLLPFLHPSTNIYSEEKTGLVCSKVGVCLRTKLCYLVHLIQS